MDYISTRALAPALSFDEVVLAGLASDGGLYVPREVPHFAPHDIARMASLSYSDLAFEIIRPFTGGSIPDADLERLITSAYQHFRHPAIAPLKQLDGDTWLLELFHGPTLAFKDFALQFLGLLVDYLLQKRGEKVVVLGATSGDTGSAAIAGCRGKDNQQIVILFPHGRVSEVQRRQMTTVADSNVHCLAVEGTFDDCQDIVKTLFADSAFRQQHKLVAVNSINWARIMAQVVYYAYACLALGAPARSVSFSVPTGNFGDIFAGYIAQQMGFPIAQLIIATNRNDILARCLATGAYTMEGVVPTLSPSMDIQISSNFERLLFDLHGRDGQQLHSMMQRFRAERSLTLSSGAHEALKTRFAAAKVDDETTKRTIARVYENTGELLDPHTAVGVEAARLARIGIAPMVCLATAHPAKFPDAVKAACGLAAALPPHLANLYELPERAQRIGKDSADVARYISAL